MISFSKYQGTGNDFILIDGFDGKESLIEKSQEAIAFLCNRRFGIGADGLIIIKESDQADFEMVYFNSDGNLGSMCGNGSRCAVAFAHRCGYIKENCSFLAFDGPHEGEVLETRSGAYKVRVKMRNVDLPQAYKNDLILNTGSPHYMKVVDRIDDLDVYNSGKAIRYSEDYKKEGINVNFICPVNDVLNVRTYERGVEDETLSCGTGVTASAISAHYLGLIKPVSSMKVHTLGGDLEVFFTATDTGYIDIWLQGAATIVFEGKVE